MHFDLPGPWGDRDVFQLCPPEFFTENGLIGATMLSVNALGAQSSAYIVLRKVVRMHDDGYPVCEGGEPSADNPPPVLLPDRAALREWCEYAALKRGTAYERAWESGAGARNSSGGAWSFLMGNKRRNLHCDYFCTYIDEMGVCIAFEPCAYDGKRYFTGYYTYGRPTVLQRWKSPEGSKHAIVRRSDSAMISQMVDTIYSWYDGGPRSTVSESIWHEGLR